MRRPEDWKLAGVDDATADSVRITVVLSPSLPNDAAPPSATPPPRSAAARIPAARRGRRMRSTLGLYPRGLNPELRSVNPPLRGLMKKYGEEGAESGRTHGQPRHVLADDAVVQEPQPRQRDPA